MSATISGSVSNNSLGFSSTYSYNSSFNGAIGSYNHEQKASFNEDASSKVAPSQRNDDSPLVASRPNG